MSTPVPAAPTLTLPREALADFCRRNGIRSLALFGSYLHGDAHPGSDIDLLVTFEPSRRVGLFGIARLQLELTDLLGCDVDLRTRDDLSEYFRDWVAAEAQIVYDA